MTHVQVQIRYCENRLTVIGAGRGEFLQAVEGAEKWQPQYCGDIPFQPLALSSLFPVPDDLLTLKSWKIYARENWGVAFGVWAGVRSIRERSIWYSFRTVSGPPQLWVIQASRLFPSLVFKLQYSTNFTPYYKGSFIYRNGKYLKARVTRAYNGEPMEITERRKFPESLIV